MQENFNSDFTVDILLDCGDVLEIDYIFEKGDSSPESDWDSRDYLKITEYRYFSDGKEIVLDLTPSFLYSKLKEELRSLEIEAMQYIYN